MAALPSGTVTFLFTDIEGSTERWERDQQAMAAAVARHLVLLGDAIQAHGGVHFKTVGDAVQAAFATAPQALSAALDGQRALLAADWDAVGGLRIRMALHAGEATPDERGDYLASPLNRLARLLATGHGGQVLLSQTVQQLTRGALPPGADLRDLGEHRLRDLTEPERVFHLLHPDLPDQFPALKSLDSRPHNLPRQPTPFLGREREVAEVVALLRREDLQVLTLTGPGGTGKTRLAMQAAAELLDDFPDGVFLVELAPLAAPNLVPSAIAAALGLKEFGDRSPLEAVTAFLRNKRLLLVLDNFEHLLAAAPIAGEVLAACPGVEVLATSRAPLHVRAERQYPVPPMTVPEPGAQEDEETLLRSEAVQLFVERAQAAHPGISLSPGTTLTIAAIVRRLDGLPLAIELAAARIRLLPPAALLARLEQRLPLLTGGARDAPARQRTLRATIAWSHDLLSEEEQTLFRRLAVSAGGFTLETAEAIVDPDGDLDVLGGVAALVDHSLLRDVDMASGDPRFTMLETVNEYALEHLDASGEGDQVRQRHARHFLALAKEANAHRFDADLAAWRARLDVEYPNLRAALQYSLDAHDGELLTLLAGALAGFWVDRGLNREGAQWLERALAGDASPSARLGALIPASVLALHRGSFRRAIELAEAALALAQHGSAGDIARAKRCLGTALAKGGDMERAPLLLAEALSFYRSNGVLLGAADVLMTLAGLSRQQGDFDQSRAFAVEAVEASRSAGDEASVARGLLHLAYLAMAEGDWDRAIDLLEDAREKSLQAGFPPLAHQVQVNLGMLLAAHRGDDTRAEPLLVETLASWQDANNSGMVALVLDMLGQLATRRGDLVEAEAHHREALAISQADENPIAGSGRRVRAMVGLGQAARARGDIAQTLRHCRDGLERLREIAPEQWRHAGPAAQELCGVTAGCLRLVASVAATGNDATRAARILGAADALRTASRTSMPHAECARAEQDAASVRAQLTENAFAEAWTAGQALSVEDAIAEALLLLNETSGRGP